MKLFETEHYKLVTTTRPDGSGLLYGVINKKTQVTEHFAQQYTEACEALVGLEKAYTPARMHLFKSGVLTDEKAPVVAIVGKQ